MHNLHHNTAPIGIEALILALKKDKFHNVYRLWDCFVGREKIS